MNVMPSAPHVVPANRTVDLEMHRRGIGPHGVENFLWPIPPLDHWAARDAIAASLFAAVRAESNGSSATEALRLVLIYILLETISIYSSQRLIGAFRRMGYDVLPPERGRVLRAVAAGTAPPIPRLVYWLNVGPPAPQRLRTPLRLVRDLVVQQKILRRVVRPIDLKRDIVSTSVDPLPEMHASRICERVIYRRWSRWHGSQSASARADHHRLAGRIVEAVAAGFVTTGEALDAHCAAGLRAWLADAIALVEARCTTVVRNGFIPRRLWTGSGGIIWHRILQWAVREAGGEVVGHDHGSGNGHVAPEIYRTMFEYETADRFVTFTPSQADGQRAALSPHLLAKPHPVVIEGLDGHTARVPACTESGARPCTVMVLSSYYFGDVTTCEGYVPDLPMLDFEARLIAELKYRGYEVIYKPHPLIVTRPPHDMAARLGATELDLPSEEVLHRADVVLMPDPLSTAFATTLASDRPAVHIDFGLAPLTPHARALLAARASIVTARFSSENRVEIDWDELAAAIDAAPGLNDTGFVNAYYGSCFAA